MSKSDDMIAAQSPLPFPVVMPVPVPVLAKSRKIAVLTKFFGMLTALALVVGILVALIAVTSERNSLQDELFCRSAASIVTTKAVNVRDNLIAKALVDVANSDMADLVSLVAPLEQANLAVDDAIAAQEVALQQCGHH